MKLVDEARQAWRWWSVRLAALAGLLAASVVADPSLLTGLLVYVPEDLRPLAATVAGIVVFAAPTVTRLLKQESKQ